MKSSNLALIIFLWGLLISIGFVPQAFAQTNECPDCGLIFNPIGTGNTTGNVALLTILNPTDKPINGSLGPYFIPGDALYQSYIIPNIIKIAIKPFDSIKINIRGWCADISKPPVPDRTPMHPFNTWISIKDENKVLNLDSSFYINPVQSPERIAPYYLKAITEIGKAYDSLRHTDLIKTPFKNFEEKEREAITQQTFWIYTSNVLGKPYTLNDFRERTHAQYEENTKNKVAALPTEQKEELNKGITDFWGSFEAVGIKAKVVPKTITISVPEEHQPTVECNCTYSFLVSVKITKDGISFNNYETVEPGLYRFEAIMAHNCHEPCEAVISGNWVVDFIPEKGAIIQTFSKESFLEYQIPSNGTLKVKFTNAKVVCNDKPCPYTGTTEDEGHPNQASITLPIRDCRCTTCEVVEPLKIINMATNTEVTQDSLPWTFNKFRLIPAKIKSNCPDDCSPYLVSSFSYEMKYNKGGSHYSSIFADPREIEIDGAGELIVTANYTCSCKRISCGSHSTVKTLKLTESNKCCDRIRRENEGQLKFNFNGGSVVISGNRMSLFIGKSWVAQETISFDFNLEALFCNLEEDQIIALLKTVSTSRARNGATMETFYASDILISRYTAPEGGTSYDLSFSKEINGKAVHISFSIDKKSCVYDIQVIYLGKVYETSGSPYLTPMELVEKISTLHNSPRNNLTWSKAMIIASHLMRASKHNLQYEYAGAYRELLNALGDIVPQEIAKTQNQSLKAELQELLTVIIECKRTMNFTKLDALGHKLSPILNAYH